MRASQAEQRGAYLQLSRRTYSFQGNLINFHSGDLNTFIVRNIGFNMVFMRLDFHFHYPQLTTQGQFAQGVGRSPGNCAIYGNGAFAVRANAVDYHMTTRLALRGGTLVLGEMTSRITMGSFQSNIQNFVGTQQQNAACNLQLQQHMPRLFVQQQAHISRTMENLFRPVVDSFVDGMTLQDLLQVISHSGPPQPCRRMAAPAPAAVAFAPRVGDEEEESSDPMWV